MSGFTPGGPLARLRERLGLTLVTQACEPGLQVASPKHRLSLFGEADRWWPEVRREFPEEEAGWRTLLSELDALARERDQVAAELPPLPPVSHGNAYFTGLGRAKRIVFFDTLIERLLPAEIEAVLAHELGHFKLRHVTKRLAFSFAASLAFLALLGWLIEQPWFYLGLGVRPSLDAGVRNDGMALVLFVLAMPVFTFVLAPLGSLLSRRHEFEADAFAARHARAEDLASALVKLYQDNASTLTPDPLHSAFYDSHPPAAVRIDRLLGARPAALASSA